MASGSIFPAYTGELIQIDGSEHRWFEDRASACTMLVYIDDRSKICQKQRVQVRVQEQLREINPVLVNREEFRASLNR